MKRCKIPNYIKSNDFYLGVRKIYVFAPLTVKVNGGHRKVSIKVL